MDYKKVYDAIVLFWAGKTPDGYYETHHILPRCLGGTDSKKNLINVPARVHFVIHQLLAKIYGGDLIVAAFLMSKDGKHGSREYAWLRELYAKNRSDFMRGNTIMVGRKLSRECLAKKSAAMKGNHNARTGKTGKPAWNTGKKMPPEQGEKISQKNKGRIKTLEERKAISLRNLGNQYGHGKLGKKTGPQKAKRSPEHCEKIRLAAIERWRKTKMSQSIS